MRFVTFDEVRKVMEGRSVAVVGSAPTVLENERGFIESHDVVVRVNNYKTGEAQGRRTDVHYSFYGSSIKKTAEELRADGVKLCMCKCPDSKPLSCDWHVLHGKITGIDFRYIYRGRKMFWFCDTYVPTDMEFMEKFFLLGKHIPTTGFSAILDVLNCEPSLVYLTGFDFFKSGIHNVNERWRPGDPNDPIRHMPELEAKWIADRIDTLPVRLDRSLEKTMKELA